MLGFDLDVWDYITFVVMAVIGLGAVAGMVFILGLPGRIAVARKHPDAEAVTLLGWAGGLAVLPWMQALIWAFKPADVVDVRRFPPEGQPAIEGKAAGLKEGEPSAGAGPRGVEPPGGSESSRRNERAAS